MDTDALGTVVGAFLTGVAGPVAAHAIKTYFDKKTAAKKDTVLQEVKFSNQLGQKVDAIREKYDADRVWITQFHNGGNYYPTGRSIQKFSIFYETITPGVPSIQLDFQNVPVSLFSKSTEYIYENYYLSIPDFKNPDVLDYGLRSIAETTHSQSCYIFAIFNIENKLIGNLGVEYVKEKRELTEDDLRDLQVEAAILSGALDNYLKNK